MIRARSISLNLALGLLAGTAGCTAAPWGAAPAAGPAAPVDGPAVPRPGVDRAALQDLLRREAERLPGRVSLHVRVDDGSSEGVSAGVNAERAMPAASVAKLPLMIAVESAWEAGKLPRAEADLRRLRAAITVSDNAAADALIDRLGMRTLAALLPQHGFRVTRLERRFGELARGKDNPGSARELTAALLRIARGEAVSPAASREMRELLLAQTRRARIPAGLPKGVTCGNKTGTWGGAVNDVAFVEPSGAPRYALAVFLADAGPRPRAEKTIAKLSAAVHRFVTRRAER